MLHANLARIIHRRQRPRAHLEGIVRRTSALLIAGGDEQPRSLSDAGDDAVIDVHAVAVNELSGVERRYRM